MAVQAEILLQCHDKGADTVLVGGTLFELSKKERVGMFLK